MAHLEIRELTPAFGAEVSGLDPQVPTDDEMCRLLQDVFDRQVLQLFLDIDHATHLYLSKMMILKEDDSGHSTDGSDGDDFYVSNKRPSSAAPFGRLQFRRWSGSDPAQDGHTDAIAGAGQHARLHTRSLTHARNRR